MTHKDWTYNFDIQTVIIQETSRWLDQMCFSGHEARLCAGADVPVHEIRLHTHLFSIGLGDAPAFMKGGNPNLNAKILEESLPRITTGSN